MHSGNGVYNTLGTTTDITIPTKMAVVQLDDDGIGDLVVMGGGFGFNYDGVSYGVPVYNTQVKAFHDWLSDGVPAATNFEVRADAAYPGREYVEVQTTTGEIYNYRFAAKRTPLTLIETLTREYVAILLDQSGSMTLPGTDGTTSRWDEGISAASSWVSADATAADGLLHAYSIWTFRNDEAQQGLRAVWPTPTTPETECADIDPDTGYCLLAPGGDYAAITQVLQGLRSSEMPITGPTTPLAQGLCDMMEDLKTLPGLKRVIFQSDGGENASLVTHPCAGAPSDPLEAFDLTLPDWGFTADSWQARVLRRAVRFGDNDLLDAVTNPVALGELMPPELSWQMGVHAAFVPEFGTPSALSLMTASPTRASTESSAAPALPFLVTAAAPLGTELTRAELVLFQALGSATPRSSITLFVPDPNVVYGVDHAIAGDVDDSGCVDSADNSILHQSDVWMRRAVPPLEIAVRADLNRDGWVNYLDEEVLWAHWGEGCGWPVGAPPFCGDGVLNGNETDLDCGGSCTACVDGLACNEDSDCQSWNCSEGYCAAISVDLCECNQTKCSDCTQPLDDCWNTEGCPAIVACTLEYPCQFPHESCNESQSCHQLTGYDQSSAAGQAANRFISCLGGC